MSFSSWVKENLIFIIHFNLVLGICKLKLYLFTLKMYLVWQNGSIYTKKNNRNIWFNKKTWENYD